MGAGAGGAGAMGAGSVGGVPSSLIAGDVPFVLQGPELAIQPGHVAKAIALLIEQFKNKPKVQNVVRAIVTQVQELEVASFDVLLLTSIDTATGVQLDVIGRIVAEARGGRDDDNYRLALRARVLINKSRGTHEEIIAIARAVLRPIGGDPPGILIVRYPPASFHIIVTGDVLVVDEAVAFGLILLAVAAGVGSRLIFKESEDTFHFSATPGVSGSSSTRGFADETQTSGGHLVGATGP